MAQRRPEDQPIKRRRGETNPAFWERIKEEAIKLGRDPYDMLEQHAAAGWPKEARCPRPGRK